MNQLLELSHEKCEELLRGSIIGRVAFSTPQGPQIVPVNYTTVADAIVFRTAPYTQLGMHAAGSPLAFEIDHVDYDDHRGWSVVAHGIGELVEHTSELEETTAFWNPKPWAGGARTLYIRLRWKALTGRRVGGGWTRDNELPVRRR
ncbi:MAG TPA: pyridoxamine 5'-phosphate oxidase family protein [Marmoricola sp.]|nr:pyridoxamine 5'-phosphate oxidase family protein [Marmoricola sp.]